MKEQKIWGEWSMTWFKVCVGPTTKTHPNSNAALSCCYCFAWSVLLVLLTHFCGGKFNHYNLNKTNKPQRILIEISLSIMLNYAIDILLKIQNLHWLPRYQFFIYQHKKNAFCLNYIEINCSSINKVQIQIQNNIIFT